MHKRACLHHPRVVLRVAARRLQPLHGCLVWLKHLEPSVGVHRLGLRQKNVSAQLDCVAGVVLLLLLPCIIAPPSLPSSHRG